ncbi:toll/interleukin-1 receptor domain-containing protein [uncultured Thiodictyon sp.]|uniref:toll/interleukin-1 receptor domain-containing protein n=1 Tax=uncultured Thiodictyon sp. TaxID=1846217 RepID=UPI0025E9B165|nr:toll/interleukin-1 receptor domain-containing protein [uncultured Thiodictyon sp.]
MQTRGIVQIIAAADGADIAEAIRAQLSGVASVAAGTMATTLPLPHENAVLVFVLTDQAVADPAVGAYAALAAGSRFAILPVVPTRTGFDFRTLTGALAFLGTLNAVGWDEGATPGDAVITAIRRHLGLEPFQRDCRLFVSYRRSDGTAAAEAIYRHLRVRGFDAFMDTKDEAIEPGEAFQTRIHEVILEKDFLLLVDSPDAADSEWVREEVSGTMNNRVAILVVRVGGSEGFPQTRDLPALDWGPDQESCLFELERAVRSRLAVRRSFDRRLQQTVETLKRLLPAATTAQGHRRLLLKVGKGRSANRCLLEFEDAPYNLARIHRLALGRRKVAKHKRPGHAVLVHRGRRLSAEEQAAVDWARRDPSVPM